MKQRSITCLSNRIHREGDSTTKPQLTNKTNIEPVDSHARHWDASENGTHYRRDVTFREDACEVSQRGAAQVLTTLRNLALGLHELALERGEIQAPSAASGCRQMTFSRALTWLKR